MRIGTRKSPLALAQAEMFLEACRAVAPDIRYELTPMSTMGDVILDRPLYELDGKGMFISVFEKALMAGEIDVAVHSGKDMPAEIPGELTVGAVLTRGSPGDVLVTLRGGVPGEHAVIGTSSLRRAWQVRTYLGYETKPVRGNVGTRLKKLQEGEVDGLILAAAGLERLSGLSLSSYELTELSLEEFLPAPTQGIIAAQCRRDTPFGELLEAVSDRETMACFAAERAYLRAVGADCRQPVAAYSSCRGNILHMTAAYWREGKPWYNRVSGASTADDGERLGEELAERILTL